MPSSFCVGLSAQVFGFLPLPHLIPLLPSLSPAPSNLRLLTSNLWIPNSQPRRLESLTSPRKQSAATSSNSQLWLVLGCAFLRHFRHSSRSGCQYPRPGRRSRKAPSSLTPHPTSLAPTSLTATVARSKFELTCSNAGSCEFSSRNKNGISLFRLPCRGLAVVLSKGDPLSGRGRGTGEALNHLTGKLLGFHPLRIFRIGPGPHADLVSFHGQRLFLKKIMAHHKTAAAKFRHRGLSQQLIPIRGRRQKPCLHVHQRNADDPMRLEQILNGQACRGKKRRGAIVEPGQIARVINNSSGIAIPPLNQYPSLIRQHFWMAAKATEALRERQAQAFESPGAPRMSIIARGSRSEAGRGRANIPP
jgi:hypothetical protein